MHLLRELFTARVVNANDSLQAFFKKLFQAEVLSEGTLIYKCLSHVNTRHSIIYPF